MIATIRYPYFWRLTISWSVVLSFVSRNLQYRVVFLSANNLLQEFDGGQYLFLFLNSGKAKVILSVISRRLSVVILFHCFSWLWLELLNLPWTNVQDTALGSMNKVVSFQVVMNLNIEVKLLSKSLENFLVTVAFMMLHATVNLFFWLDIESKSVWFFLPIGIALLINTVIFALTCKAVCALDAQARELGITSGQRSKVMERYVIYAKMMLITIPDILSYTYSLYYTFLWRFLTFLKLFLGMGILWTFEVISGLVEDQTAEESWLVFIDSIHTPKRHSSPDISSIVNNCLTQEIFTPTPATSAKISFQW